MRAMVSLLPRSRVDTALLKLAHPIAHVVARYGVELKRQGRAMVGRCIFHTYNGRPNLYVYGDSESWRCYRCGIGGDVLAFVMHAENIAFREAVDRLTGASQGPVRPASRPAPAPRPAISSWHFSTGNAYRLARRSSWACSPEQATSLWQGASSSRSCVLGDRCG